MTINLDELRTIAEAATPGPWTLEYENSDDWEAGINDGDYPHTIHGPRNCSFDNWTDKSKVQDSLNRITEITEMTDADATHIATFDPPTVLALITRLEQAEENLESALEANKRWAHRSSRETSELRKAEAAVARVREVLEHHTFVADDKYGDLAASQYYGDSELEAVAAKSITRALDGDGRA